MVTKAELDHFSNNFVIAQRFSLLFSTKFYYCNVPLAFVQPLQLIEPDCKISNIYDPLK